MLAQPLGRAEVFEARSVKHPCILQSFALFFFKRGIFIGNCRLTPGFCRSMFQVRDVVSGGNHSFSVCRSDQIAFGDPGTSPHCD